MKKITFTVLPILTLALVVGLTACPALAQEKVDRTVDAEADGLISIENVAGSVTVSGWDKDMVEVTGRLGRGTEGLDVIEKGDRIIIKVVLPRGRNRNIKGSHLKIKVPRGSSLDVETVSADIEVEGVRGELELESVSGDIVARGEAAEVEFETVSGDITSFVETNRLAAASVSGDVQVEGVRGIVVIDNVSGETTITGDEINRLNFDSVSGDLVFTGSLGSKADFRIDVHSGDVTLGLIGDLDADFEIETFSGDIDSDFGGKARRTSKYAPGRELEFTVGDGSARVEIETFNGDVSILKK